MSLKEEWSFRENRIARENIGKHDADNRFLLEDILGSLLAGKVITRIVLLLVFAMMRKKKIMVAILWFLKIKMAIVSIPIVT